MNHSDFPTLHFKNIVVKEISNHAFFFYFKLDECSYLLQVESSVPKSIQHMPNDRGLCNFCGNQYFLTECAFLEKHVEQVYHQLKNHPSIRLRMLYKKA